MLLDTSLSQERLKQQLEREPRLAYATNSKSEMSSALFQDWLTQCGAFFDGNDQKICFCLTIVTRTDFGILLQN